MPYCHFDIIIKNVYQIYKIQKIKLIYSYKIINFSHIYYFHFYCVFPLPISEVLHPLLFWLQRTKAEKSQKQKLHKYCLIFFKDIFLNHISKIHFKRILKIRSYFFNTFTKKMSEMPYSGLNTPKGPTFECLRSGFALLQSALLAGNFNKEIKGPKLGLSNIMP